MTSRRQEVDIRMWVASLVLVGVVTTSGWASTNRAVQDRLDRDIEAGSPVVVHVVVALCDNANQGIVPVPKALGNGQDPEGNLYWGALYGVQTHLPRAAGWTKLGARKSGDNRILDRAVFFATVDRDGTSVPVYVVADAWDGAHIREALQAYLNMAAGNSAQTVELNNGTSQLKLRAGGSAHLVVYVGHNGLMDFSMEPSSDSPPDAPAKSAVVLACASKSYFLDHLRAAGAHPLLLTTGLMAPEAYTLDAAIRSWIREGTTAAVIQAAAEAYDHYQKCGIGAAQRLFWGAQ